MTLLPNSNGKALPWDPSSTIYYELLHPKKLPTQIGIASILLDNNTQIGVYPFLLFLTVWFVVSFISPEKSKLS
jgi:hypothetical protein